jgi:pimeloyl-ACP methyl ester carboxylesterase
VDGAFALVAHSGATLGAIALAAAAPERVSHLVLQGAMGRPLPPIAGFLTGLVGDLEAGRLEASRDAVRGPALGGGHPDQDEIERRVLASQAEVSRERFVAQCRFIVENMDQTARLPEVRAPTLFVHARNDGYFDLDLTAAISADVPASRLVVVEDSGHLMAVEQPQALTALIGLWCETRAAAGVRGRTAL